MPTIETISDKDFLKFEQEWAGIIIGEEKNEEHNDQNPYGYCHLPMHKVDWAIQESSNSGNPMFINSNVQMKHGSSKFKNFRSQNARKENKVMFNSKNLRNLATKDAPPKFICEDCNTNCDTKEQLEQHLNGQKHKRKIQRALIYKCDACNTGLLNFNDFKLHLKSAPHKNFCETCQFVSENPELMEHHMAGEEHKQKAQELMKCDICKIGPMHKIEFEAHIIGDRHKKNVLLANNPYHCDICNVHCFNEERLQIHLEGARHARKINLSNQSSFKCNICNIFCSGSQSLQQHYEGAKHKKIVENIAGNQEKRENMKDENTQNPYNERQKIEMTEWLIQVLENSGDVLTFEEIQEIYNMKYGIELTLIELNNILSVNAKDPVTAFNSHVSKRFQATNKIYIQLVDNGEQDNQAN